ncbi:META domain-containing protein [Gloeothece verrucosa]|uniref:DUF306 domain-containing protein n=1 Tax=Gloeothece verrucosa (strain PCC 7822) TaxID=497965 RepID=E0U8L4_GLOV7|nr:META domain-containing protein [Gloeothece verrucosa]ADN13760.1 protein of unknown function DUF306 Meta and HslJ [Gloeothece verrucosa PCC 7822]
MNIFKSIKKAVIFGLLFLGLTFAVQNPSYATELKGDWTLVSIGNEPVLNSAKITASFDDEPDNVIYGSAGCNRYIASFCATENRILIGPVATTQMLCHPQAIMKQEGAYIQALEAAKYYEVSEQHLKLSDGNNQTLEYVKDP